MKRIGRLAATILVGVALAAVLDLAGIGSLLSEAWAGIVLLMTCGVLMLAVVGGACGGPGDRPALLGFALFGWGYFLLARWYSSYQGLLPTVALVSGAGRTHRDLLSLPPIVRAAHDAWALAFAILGSRLASHIKGMPAGGTASDEDDSPVGVSAGWWRKPAWVGPLGLVLVAAPMLSSWRSDPETGAGAAFLLTWALEGLCLLGAILARGRRRRAWSGAAGFGLGYLVLAFGPLGPPDLPTNHLLNVVFHPGGRIPTGEPNHQPVPFAEDPAMIAGHSLLAILAMGSGAAAASIVAGAGGAQGASRAVDHSP